MENVRFRPKADTVFAGIGRLDTGLTRNERKLVKNPWLLLYAAIFAASFLLGGAFGQEDLSRANIDWYFVAICFICGLVFPTLAMWQARDRKLTPVPSPSFLRGLRGGWWSDPLQWLRISVLSLSGWFLGALVSVQGASGQSVMTLYWKGCLTLGFLLGDVLARNAFRKDIASKDRN